jgi:hypothetical protein
MPKFCRAQAMAIGDNLDTPAYYDTAHVFADAIYDFGPPGQVNNPTQSNPSLTYDAQNNPQQSFSSLSNLSNYPNGVYQLSYTFENGTPSGATVSFGFDDYVSMSNVQTINGVVTANVTIQHPISTNLNSGSIFLTVNNNVATNPVTGLHLISPGYSTTNTPLYTPQFIQRTTPFSSLRFMDWSEVNNSTVVNWSQRTQPTQTAIQGAVGVSYENEIALVNETGHNIWVNIPYEANANYVKQMADLFKADLNSNATIQVELSNEVWNTTYQQYFQNSTVAQANSALTDPDAFGRAAQQYAVTAMQDSLIWKQEFGSQASRIQFIFGGQNTQPYWAQQGLGYLNTTYGNSNNTAAQNISQWFSAYAIAPYFADNAAQVQAHNSSASSLLAYALSEVVAGGDIDQGIQQAKTLANQYGLALDAYEGGDAFPNSNNNLSASLLSQVENDPAMYTIYQTLYNTWQSDGGGLFMAFSHIDNDGYALLSNDSLDGSQKWDATISRLVLAGDCNLDGVVNFQDLLTIAKDFGKTGMFWQDGDFNHDGVVNNQDLLLAAENYGDGAAFAPYTTASMQGNFSTAWAQAETDVAAETPEPTCLGWIIGGGLLALSRRRHRKSSPSPAVSAEE